MVHGKVTISCMTIKKKTITNYASELLFLGLICI